LVSAVLRAAPTVGQIGVVHMALDELREPRLHERAALVLASDVVSGRLAAGERFPSADEIVDRFGVSRTVAREALQTLSMLGIVRVQHGKRTEVLPSDHWDMLNPVVHEALRREDGHEPLLRDLYEFRLVIEPQAAAWMAERGSEGDLARLAGLAAEMRVLSEDPANTPRVLAADQDFHRLIAHAAGNRILAAFSRSFWEAVSVLWMESHLSADETQQVAHHHQEIADAITRRDPEAAAEAMTRHLQAASTLDLGGRGPQED
jgi:GntR family transcriptional repressor for pyruvate dehydrogenase complex